MTAGVTGWSHAVFNKMNALDVEDLIDIGEGNCGWIGDPERFERTRAAGTGISVQEATAEFAVEHCDASPSLRVSPS